MTQTAIVTAVSGDRRARVEVRRQSACGHDCERCAGCGTAAAIQVEAQTDLPLAVGDRVEISSDAPVLAYAGLVYLMPLALTLLGYSLPFPTEGLRIAGCAAGFALGLLVTAAVDRRLRRTGRTVTYRVTRVL